MTQATPTRPTIQAGTSIRRRRPFRKWFRDLGWRHVVAFGALVFALFPALWTMSAAFNPLGTLTTQQLIPDSVSLVNFRELLSEDVPFRAWYVNTLVVGGVAAGANMMLSAFAAYAFSRMRFTGRRVGLLTVLLIQMFPQLLAFIAIFLMMDSISNFFPAVGLGTLIGLILVYMGGAMGVNTWLMKGFFDTIPSSLDESAKVDGATHGQIFFRIILPLAAPILAVMFLLGFIFAINEYILASAILGQGDPSHFTLAVGLSRYLLDGFTERWGPFAAGSILAGVPVIILFIFLQRYIVSGLTQGAVKG
ncbi:MAG TPA: sugar ABC transporter permease [Acidimicrobiia bacterium]|jgi:arabinogalactan oligomer/maltooligosaccharide transport system permease protein